MMEVIEQGRLVGGIRSQEVRLFPSRLLESDAVPRFGWFAATGIAAAAATAWVVCGWDPVSGHVTSYAATCLRREADNRCAAIGRTFDPEVFRVSKVRQRVEFLGGDGGSIQLRSCTVVSKKDWRCRSVSDDAHEFGLSGGRAWVRIEGTAAPDVVFLPRWKYLWLKTGEPSHEMPRPFFR